MTIGPAYGAWGMERAQMLASGADRERAVDFLKTAFAEERLSAEEYERRLGLALAARTYADLDAVTVDLPGARPAVPPRPPGTNALAITAMICGIAEFFTFGLTAVPAAVLGHVARRQIRQSRQDGEGLALAAVVLGWIGIGLWVLFLGLIALGAVALSVGAASYPPAGG